MEWLGITPSYLTPYASNIVYSFVLAFVFAVALLVGRRTKNVPVHEQEPTQTPRLATKTVALEPKEPLVLSLKQFKFREEVRAELKRIYWPLYDVVVRKRIEFKSWNELREPDFHSVKHGLIATKEQDEAIEAFSTALNKRNDNLFQANFEELNEECVTRYGEIRKSGFLDSDAAPLPEKTGTDYVAPLPLEAHFRLEPPIGIENIPEPNRSRIESDSRKTGHLRSQQVYVRAVNGDLTDCEAKVVVDNNGVNHMLWEGIRREPPAQAKDKVTVHRDDEKYLTLWYAQQKDDKEYLYIPITTVRHMSYYIGPEHPPLVVDIWLIAKGFSDERPRRFIIYRESWDGIFAKEVGNDGIPFAECDGLWHLTSELHPSVVCFAPRGSDKASSLHISHRGKKISLTGRMCGLTPLNDYQVEIENSYVLGELGQELVVGEPVSFTTDSAGAADWSLTLSADELASHGFERFSVWIIDLHHKLKVLMSDNLAFHA